MIWNEKPRLPPPVARSLRNRTVVSAETTATTNITGFLARLLRIELPEGAADGGNKDASVHDARGFGLAHCEAPVASVNGREHMLVSRAK